jgi:phosphoribosylformylglycinamidine synthase I
MRAAIVTFPGSNCDYDCYQAVAEGLGAGARYVWHRERDLPDCDLVILPGGFSYGDYLRTGAIARFSPVMQSVIEFAQRGKPVIGICNGFQILLEAGLLPGAMMVNRGLQFVCDTIYLKPERTDLPFTAKLNKSKPIRIPIAHKEGNYYADAATLDQIERNGQVVFRYCNARGETDEVSNPNGSLHSIAGITNQQGNVLGMMPHPERAMDKLLGSADGRLIFESIAHFLK